MAQPQTKQIVRDLLDRLPDDCSLRDVQYHLYLLEAATRGIEDADAGRVVSHDQLTAELRAKWQLEDA